ncbi:17654_t:CDS:1 [Funneliformis caledonium]|uniref:17654_t:CDS:1 n=1 Tax=Funneliformis caledonium TaxID=1117310 RepID=A0A9N8YQW4_9GLOM|nr:17654_t:CDS:1 [Funneliformis caledonium]
MTSNINPSATSFSISVNKGKSPPKRSHSPDTHQPSRQQSRNHRRRHTLPSKFHHHPNTTNNPPYSKHAHHYEMGDSIDTTSLNQGIVFYQDSDNGEVDYYWDHDNESEICSPSLMPGNSEIIAYDKVSGDSSDLEEKYFKIMARELSRQQTAEPTEDMDVDNTSPPKDDEQDVNDMIKEMNELLKNNDLGSKEARSPPSPTSPRDPERGDPVLSEEEENAEGAVHMPEHDPEFQDEAGLGSRILCG